MSLFFPILPFAEFRIRQLSPADNHHPPCLLPGSAPPAPVLILPTHDRQTTCFFSEIYAATFNVEAAEPQIEAPPYFNAGVMIFPLEISGHPLLLLLPINRTGPPLLWSVRFPDNHHGHQIRMKISISSGIALRMARMASKGKRALFSRDPPYSSVRWLIPPDRKE